MSHDIYLVHFTDGATACEAVGEPHGSSVDSRFHCYRSPFAEDERLLAKHGDPCTWDE
ncbi:hypothetical protein [Candidatus Accumulibacter aalborgensis]|uniref:hypothetical protein n=1 Tax=Candidatus Accumulibacter aalborgensis TaxID=1860102 RepID=UPI00164433DD|nr:hypothetical protein [Candidatus Accumulibacter aalborgensis]